MTAAYLNDHVGNIATINYEQTDVFAYTFEAPRNTKDKQCRHEDKYGNIKNIVNPIDPVPMVAMEKWGYERYGIDYHIPCSATTSNYGRLSVEACNYYDAIIGYTHLYLPHVAGQQYLLQGLVDDIAGFTKNDSTTETEALTAVIQSTMLSKFKDKSFVPVGDILKSVLKIYLDRATLGLYKEKKIIGWMLEEIAQSHYADLTLAWMWTLDQDTLTYYNNKQYYRLVKINCPVDVSVFDSENNLVAQIIDDVPQEINGSTIESLIDLDDQKVVVLPMDAQYKVELKATDDGEMTYSVSDVNISTGKTEHRRNYYNLELHKDEFYTDIVPELSSTNKTVDLMTDNNNSQIAPGEDLSGTDIVDYSVEITAEGNGSVEGACQKKKGEFTTIYAYPENGETFLGWYEGQDLISTSKEYRFCVKEDMFLTGRFSNNQKEIKTEDTKISRITLTGISTQIAAGKSIQLTSTVLPKNATNKKLKWTSSNTKVATVSQKGKVSIKKGTGGKSVTITAKATDGSGKKAAFKIKVMKGAVKSIKIKNAKKTLKVGKTMKLKATVKVTKGKPVNKKVKWSSSNKKYATVSSKGVVKAQKEGKGKKVTITAMATDGTGKKKKVTIKIK